MERSTIRIGAPEDRITYAYSACPNAPGIDEPICMIDVAHNNAIYYYHFDGLGSVVALSDSSGNMVESYSYDVFGEPNTTSSIGNPYMFTGRKYDSETGIYYDRARYYDPYIGRFLQTDPIGFEDDLNLYTYVHNNPIIRADPLGLWCRTILWDTGGEWISPQFERRGPWHQVPVIPRPPAFSPIWRRGVGVYRKV